MTISGTEQFADDNQRYRLDSRIATGGMGEVWRGTDSVLGRQVAIKLLKTEYADDATFRSRFETEARHAAALHHPGVAGVFDVGESGATDGAEHPRPFLVMELVEGQPLSALLADGRELDPVAVRDLMGQAGEALGAAHRAGIVHRDVKPANLMVTPQGQIKVTDFGIARAADGVQITRTGAVMGTPQYLSPEQARGETATAASDVYALGVVTFECLANRRPFEADSPVATALAHLQQPVPDLPDSVPADLAAVVRRSLDKDPRQRYADGAAFAAALRDPATAALAVPPPVPVPAGGDTATQVMGAAAPVAPVPPLGPPTSTTTTSTEDSRRSPWPIVAAVALLAALAVVVVLLLTGGEDDGDTPAADTTSTRGQGGGGQSSEPASPSETSEPTEEPEETEEPPPEPTTVFVNPGEYVGRQLDEVESDLGDLGLGVDPQEVENDGSLEEGVVTAVSPDGNVEEGATITVEYAGPAPEEPEEPEVPTETPTETPTDATTAPSTEGEPG